MSFAPVSVEEAKLLGYFPCDGYASAVSDTKSKVAGKLYGNYTGDEEFISTVQLSGDKGAKSQRLVDL